MSEKKSGKTPSNKSPRTPPTTSNDNKGSDRLGFIIDKAFKPLPPPPRRGK